MLNRQEVLQGIAITLIYTLLTLLALTPIALANTHEPDIYDLWNNVSEFEEVSSLRKFFLDKNWISDHVSIDELDYILVLTRQCSEEFFPAVPVSLVLAVISMESSFDKDLVGFSDDTGLMQIIPKYHRERIDKYRYNEKVDLYDPRLNIMVGMDYLDELLNWARGDLERTLMAYNMGPSVADRFASRQMVSLYAREAIERMTDIENFFERRNGLVCDGCQEEHRDDY